MGPTHFFCLKKFEIKIKRMVKINNRMNCQAIILPIIEGKSVYQKLEWVLIPILLQDF